MDEDRMANNEIARRRLYRVYIRHNHLLFLNDEEFRYRFRLNKTQFQEVLLQIESKIVQRELNNAVPPVIQLLATLRFYATGCFLQMIGDFSGMCTKTAQTIVHRVSFAIADLLKRYVKLPQSDLEIMENAKNNFYISGMIRVAGAIDCVHICIESYGGDDAELWRNRKGFFSINTQCLVNSDLEILDIVVRWPGSTHDSTIFEHSRLKQRLDNMELKNCVILGDRGYPNGKYLITPLANPTTPAEILYNEAHIRTRCMVERCFGIWGRMFSVLTIGSRFKTPVRTINVIIATAILYNITRRDKKKSKNGMQRYIDIEEVYASPTDDDRKFLIENCNEVLSLRIKIPDLIKKLKKS
ncbi:putative nuclease HARBI1 [Prorops nasuta]|uniref:putative nuclease HARBI1 n=1 Tax=Prorops nasuta TaxID=863751 RepID=UPI0034D00FE1